MTCIDRTSKASNSFQGNVPWSVKYQHDIHAHIWFGNENFWTMSQDRTKFGMETDYKQTCILKVVGRLITANMGSVWIFFLIAHRLVLDKPTWDKFFTKIKYKSDDDNNA